MYMPQGFSYMRMREKSRHEKDNRQTNKTMRRRNGTESAFQERKIAHSRKNIKGVLSEWDKVKE